MAGCLGPEAACYDSVCGCEFQGEQSPYWQEQQVALYTNDNLEQGLGCANVLQPCGQVL